MNFQVIRYHFYIRFIGALSALSLIGLSAYREHFIWLVLVVICYIVINVIAKERLFFFKNEKAHIYNLFLDVLLLSVAIAIRGGLRSDFYLGYFLILGYILFVREKYLMMKMSIWIVICYSLFTYFFTQVGMFSFGRLFIRLLLLIGTSFLLQNYSKLLSETENLKEKAMKMALIDSLTGLYNRRILENIDSFYVQVPLKLYIVMIDIDNFKYINDNYGHPRGDEIIVALAEELKKVLSHDSICLRYGGEEFLILFHYETKKDISMKVNSVQKAIINRKFDWKNSKDGITFTAGIATKEAEDSIQKTIEKADMALYDGKKSGKNCIVWNKL